MRTFHAAVLLSFLFLWGADTHAARLQLSWTDNSLNELGFNIERRQGGDETFSVIATQGVNVESYADHGLLPATAYCYRVRAFNDAGYSGYSNESCTTTSPIEMSFEGPGDTQSVAGLGVIRGWSFDARLGQQIKALKLFIDDAQVLRIPCCSPRGDVQAGFPQLPAQNTLNSGWGTAVNWGALASGTHVVQLRAESTSGQTLATDRHTVTTVRFADFSFVDLLSLAHAAVWIDGNDLVVERVVVRDKNSQRQAQVTMRLRWLSNEQSFRVVATETTAHAAAPHSVLSPVLAAVRKWLPLGPAVAAAQSSTPILGMIESPGFGQVSAGIGVLRGWAFSGDSAATIRTIQAFVDGQLRPGAQAAIARAQGVPYVVSGQGIGMGIGRLIGHLVQSGQLVAPFGTSVAGPHGYYIIRSAATGARPHVQAFVDWLIQEAEGAKLTGPKG